MDQSEKKQVSTVSSNLKTQLKKFNKNIKTFSLKRDVTILVPVLTSIFTQMYKGVLGARVQLFFLPSNVSPALYIVKTKHLWNAVNLCTVKSTSFGPKTFFQVEATCVVVESKVKYWHNICCSSEIKKSVQLINIGKYVAGNILAEAINKIVVLAICFKSLMNLTHL